MFTFLAYELLSCISSMLHTMKYLQKLVKNTGLNESVIPQLLLYNLTATTVVDLKEFIIEEMSRNLH